MTCCCHEATLTVIDDDRKTAVCSAGLLSWYTCMLCLPQHLTLPPVLRYVEAILLLSVVKIAASCLHDCNYPNQSSIVIWTSVLHVFYKYCTLIKRWAGLILVRNIFTHVCMQIENHLQVEIITSQKNTHQYMKYHFTDCWRCDFIASILVIQC